MTSYIKTSAAIIAALFISSCGSDSPEKEIENTTQASVQESDGPVRVESTTKYDKDTLKKLKSEETSVGDIIEIGQTREYEGAVSDGRDEYPFMGSAGDELRFTFESATDDPFFNLFNPGGGFATIALSVRDEEAEVRDITLTETGEHNITVWVLGEKPKTPVPYKITVERIK